jgi:hypothetical protein
LEAALQKTLTLFLSPLNSLRGGGGINKSVNFLETIRQILNAGVPFPLITEGDKGVKKYN